MQLENLIEENTLYSFYGVHDNEFKLGEIVFEAIEDHNDGYRSYLDSIEITNSKSVFSRLPIINLYYRKVESHLNGIEFFDETGHVWLAIGTNCNDDYYPWFYFDYTPRTDVQEYSEPINNLNKYDPKYVHAEKLI